MLFIRTDVTETTEGEWKELTLYGQKFELKIRPLTESVEQAIRNKHKKIKKYMGQSVPEFNEEKILDNTIDYLIEDIRGLGDTATGKAMEVNLKNKKALMSMQVTYGEVAPGFFVREEAKRLGVITDEDEKGNSKPLPEGTPA